MSLGAPVAAGRDSCGVANPEGQPMTTTISDFEAIDDIEKARQEGYDQGYLDGREVERELVKQQVLPMIDTLDTLIDVLADADA
jgi:hypothetical protein